MSISRNARCLALATIAGVSAVFAATLVPVPSLREASAQEPATQEPSTQEPATQEASQEDTDGLLYSVVAPPEELDQGATGIVVEVRASNADNLAAFGFQLEFDAEILEVAIDPETQQPMIQRGDFLGSTGREVACNEPASQPGVLRLECVTLRLEPAGPDGDGLLATITFNAIGSGTSPLTLDRVQANNPDATVVDPISVQSSQLSVKGDASINWLLWGGIIAIGAVAAIAVAFVAMKLRTRGGPPTASTTQTPPAA